MKSPAQFLTAVAALLVLSATGSAQLITGETATASSAIPGPPTFGFDRVAAHVVDDSGLTAGDNLASTPDQMHTDIPDGFMWLSTGNDPFGGVDPNPTFTVDLGALYDLTGVRVFNYNENNGNGAGLSLRGVKDTNVLISPDGVTYTPLGPVTFALASASPTYTGEFFNLVALTGGVVTTRFMQFDIQTNYGGDNNFYGLSELQFDGTLNVPEPASVGFLALGGAGLFARRRRS